MTLYLKELNINSVIKESKEDFIKPVMEKNIMPMLTAVFIFCIRQSQTLSAMG
jgi:hypothetical protein